jgi:hypothetical protein
MTKLTLDDIQKKSNSIHNSEYTINGEYINHGTPILIKHNVCGYEWKVRLGNHFGGKKCPMCAGNAKLTKEAFQAKSNEIHNNEYLVIGEYKSVDEQIGLKHISCGNEFKCNCQHVYTKWDKDNFIEKSNEIHNSEYKLLSEFINIDTKILLEHTICGYQWESLPKKHIHHKQGCPNCNESKGEKDIKRCLNDSNIDYVIQKKFDDCRNVHPLPFDFYLPEYNTCIEFDGIQHFEASEWFGGQDALNKNIIRDNIKNKYCEENKIKLYRISYLDNLYDKLNLILQELLKIHTKQL